MSIPKALTIAGSDSGGGAGVQADLKTFSAFRVFGMSAVTAVTAQSTRGVSGLIELAPEFVALQIDTVLGDLGADAIKVGMLATAAIVEIVADRLGAHPTPVVLDPVMVASSGDRLLREDAHTALVKRLLPLAAVVTPNLHEAAALADMEVATEADMAEAARRIVGLGARHVLVKGGHLAASATDLLWDGHTLTRLSAPRAAPRTPHGAGCTLSAAIAAGLAHGRALEPAIRDAKAYVTAAIRAAFTPGAGAPVLCHFVADW
jgi:hydroxymethylpyrimidine/phosphomethylpyrimidine kinase